MIDPYVILAMPFNFILSSIHLYHRNIYPVFIMEMSPNMILVIFVIPFILLYDFNILTILYIHVHISHSFL